MNMETIFMNTENGKINGLHKFISEKKKMLFFKTYLFITCGKVSDNSTKTIN